MFEKRDEHFNEHFPMKRCQHRSKQIKYAHSYGLAGFMRKIGTEHGNDENRLAKHLKRINVNC